MSRQRLIGGTFGDIGFLASPNGRVVARARYRDWGGKNRLVQATGDTQRAAELALKAKLAERSLFQPAESDLTPDSPFPDLVTYWLEDLELEGRVSKRTLQLYERNIQTLVLPVFESLTLREIGVARCDHFLKSRATTAPSKPAPCSDSHSASPSGTRYCRGTRWTTSRDCAIRRRRRTR